jgi:putative inorganic carbon (hco3(-)) transporter
MSRLLVFLYLVAQLVRPQDWFGPLMGFPTGYVLTLLMFLTGFTVYLRDRQFFSIPHNRLVPLYVLVIFIATWHGTQFGQGLDEATNFAKRALAFFGIVWLVNTPERVRFTLSSYLVLAVFLAFQAILQAQNGVSWGGATLMPGYEEIRVRWHGDWDGPNVFAILFIISFAIALERVFGPYGVAARIFGAVVGGLSLVSIFFTNSRGAVLAVLALTAYYFKDRFSKPVALVLAVGTALAVTVFGPSRMSEVNTNEASAHERTWLWEQGLQLLRDNPVFGIGRAMFSKRVDLGLIAHNNYVQNFAELGLPGFFIFISLLWFSLKAGLILARLKSPEHAWAASFGRTILGIFIGYAIATFFVVMELDLLYFMMGLCMAIYLSCRRRIPDLPVFSMTWTDVKIVVAGMVALISAVWFVAHKA